MRALGLLAFAFPLLAQPCLAEFAEKAEPLADCSALFSSIPDVAIKQGTHIEDIDGGCRVANLFWVVDSYIHYRVAEVILLSPDILRALPAGELPAAADLTLKGLRIAPQTGSPLQDYIISLSGNDLDIHLAYTTDPAELTGAVDFELGAGNLGRLAMSAKLSDVDYANVTLFDLAEIAGTLDHFEASLDDTGLFANIFAPIVLSALLPVDQDPRPLIAAAQETAIATLSNGPEAVMTDQSLAALSALIRAFPQPEGQWALSIDSEAGIPLGSLSSGDLSALAALIPGARVTVSGAPAAP